MTTTEKPIGGDGSGGGGGGGPGGGGGDGGGEGGGGGGGGDVETDVTVAITMVVTETPFSVAVTVGSILPTSDTVRILFVTREVPEIANGFGIVAPEPPTSIIAGVVRVPENVELSFIVTDTEATTVPTRDKTGSCIQPCDTGSGEAQVIVFGLDRGGGEGGPGGGGGDGGPGGGGGDGGPGGGGGDGGPGGGGGDGGGGDGGPGGGGDGGESGAAIVMMKLSTSFNPNPNAHTWIVTLIG